MADYYSILNNTIAKLGTNTADTRASVYGKARAAIDRQLRAIQPTPSEEAISRQMQMLEEAIGKVEAEQSALEAAAPVFSASPEATSSMPASAVEQPVRGAGPAEPEHYPEPDTLSGSEADLEPPASDYRDTGERERRGGGMVGKLIALVLVLGVIGGGAYALWLNKDALLGGTGQKSGLAASDTEQAADPETDTGTADEAAEEPAEEDAAQTGAQQPKEEVRLGSDGQTREAPPVEQPDVSQPDGSDDSPIVIDGGGESEPQSEAPVEVDEVGEDTAPDEASDTGAEDTAQSEAADPAVSPAVAQKAFLYEEGGGGQGARRSNGAIVWSLDREAPADGEPEEAVIRGQLDVPEKGMTMTLAIKRNSDPGLPASHIIEILFSVPADFSGGNVEDIARFVMKGTEQARGEGLIAVPARIDAGFFLIALNNLDQAIETNRKLLIDSNWIDIPMAYSTGRRALVTLEKGAIGDKVFRDAFADWQTR